MLSDHSYPQNSPPVSPLPTPPRGFQRYNPRLVRPQAMDTASKNNQQRERLISNSGSQRTPRVNKRPQTSKHVKPAHKNTRFSQNEEISVNEKLYAQTIAGGMDLWLVDERPSTDADDIPYALARFLSSGRRRSSEASNPSIGDIEPFRGPTPLVWPTKMEYSSQCSQWRATIPSSRSDSPVDVVRRSSTPTLDKGLTHMGAQFKKGEGDGSFAFEI
ncbi:hypothetical protein TWF730_004567 [Orbilia blumenaviensis]|uniref:Uncharacterized protein n=1 Tax=Orbilia blumenaviensis TaxID=1796055 RepID=A0AAV9U2K3_9PEZI